MSRHTAKNYRDQGGDKWVVGGELQLAGKMTDADGNEINPGGGGGEIPDGAVTTAKVADGAITTAKLGTDVTNLINGKLTATKVETQANSTAEDISDLVADFNALLAKLKAAEIME